MDCSSFYKWPLGLVGVRMRRYPVFLDLAAKRCLVAGAGEVGRRKLQTLLECGPEQVLVLDPYADPALPELAVLLAHPAAEFEPRSWNEQDLDDRFLVIAASGDARVNEQLTTACRTRGILVNRIDAPADGDFIVPAGFAMGDLQLAISTSGQSPALARRIRQDLQAYLGLRYETFLVIMGRLRPLVLAQGKDSRCNTRLFRSLVDSSLSDACSAGDLKAVAGLLEELLPVELHPRIEDILYGLV